LEGYIILCSLWTATDETSPGDSSAHTVVTDPMVGQDALSNRRAEEHGERVK